MVEEEEVVEKRITCSSVEVELIARSHILYICTPFWFLIPINEMLLRRDTKIYS